MRKGDYIGGPMMTTRMMHIAAGVFPDAFPRWYWLERLQAALVMRRFYMVMAMVAAKRKREEER